MGSLMIDTDPRDRLMRFRAIRELGVARYVNGRAHAVRVKIEKAGGENAAYREAARMLDEWERGGANA